MVFLLLDVSLSRKISFLLAHAYVKHLGALNFFQHFENALGCANKQTFECFAQATTLKRVAAIAFDFRHGDLRS